MLNLIVLFHVPEPNKLFLVGVFTPHRLEAKKKELQARLNYSDTQAYLSFVEFRVKLNKEFEY